MLIPQIDGQLVLDYDTWSRDNWGGYIICVHSFKKCYVKCQGSCSIVDCARADDPPHHGTVGKEKATV